MKNVLMRSTLVFALVLFLAFAWTEFSSAQTNTPDLESLKTQLIKLQEQLQLMQSSVVGATGVRADTAAQRGCINNKITHRHNTVLAGLTLSNGFVSNLKGYQYRCNNGRWVMEKTSQGSSLQQSGQIGTVNSNKTTPVTSATKCISGTTEYPEGTKRNTITENGVSRAIADASFVCRSGRWVIEGSLPHDSRRGSDVTNGSEQSCKVGTRTYTHGQTIPKVLTLPGFSSANYEDFARFPLLERVTCSDGRWVPEGQTGKKACSLADGKKADHGSISSRPALPGINSSVNTPTKQYLCTDGKWSELSKTCTVDGVRIGNGDSVTVSTSTRAVGATGLTNQRVTFMCRNGQLVR